MRRLIFATNLTLDGCCDHTKGSGDDETLRYHEALLHDADTLLYGRITYQLMVPFWPDVAKNNSGQTAATNDFAHAFSAVKNIVVFSRTLEEAQEDRTRVVRSDLHGEVIRMKEQEGKNILVGGADLPSQLIQLGLVDEFRVLIQPTLVGDGRRLLEGLQLHQKLKLLQSTTLPNGIIALQYVKA